MPAYYSRSGRLIHVRERTQGRSCGRIIAEHRDPALPGTVVTHDEHGDTRRGPAGAWWTHLSDRPSNSLGITPELPSARATAWNLALLGVETGLIGWAHFAVGVPWATIAAALGAVLLLGVAGLAYVACVHTPRAIRRHQAQLRAHVAAPPTTTTDPHRDDTRPDDTSTGRAA